MKLRNAKKLNMRGFTIVELTMVMAISAIIAVMIVSFSVLISAQVKKNQLRADFMQATVDFRNDLYKEFGKVDGTATTNPDNPLLYTVTVEDDIIKIENPSFSFQWNEYEYISNVSVDAENGILRVTLGNEELNETQSFVLISKCGGEFEEGQ